MEKDDIKYFQSKEKLKNAVELMQAYGEKCDMDNDEIAKDIIEEVNEILDTAIYF